MYKNSPLCLPQRGEIRRRLVRKNLRIALLRITIFILTFLINTVSFAQNKVDMADTMRSNGKIYVVVAVCLTILIGLFIYVSVVDKKISRVEKNKE